MTGLINVTNRSEMQNYASYIKRTAKVVDFIGKYKDSN